MHPKSVLLVGDLDGTLLNRNGQISSENAQALQEFMQQGGLFTIATGRDPEDIMHFFPDSPPNAPLSCFNGSMIYDWETRSEKMRLFLDESILPLLDSLVESDPRRNVEVFRDDGTYIWNPGEGTKKHREVVDFTPTWIDDYHRVPFPWTKVAFWLSPQEIPALARDVAQADPEHRWNFLRVHEWSCELLHPRSDKGYTLDWYREAYPDRTIVTVGDNDNDALMLQRADISFAPQNAYPSAKAAAGCVLPESCDEHIAQAVLRKLANLP